MEDEDEDDDELEVGQLGEAVSLPAAKKVVPKGSQHPRGKTGLPHCTPDGMGQVCDAFPLASRTWTKKCFFRMNPCSWRTASARVSRMRHTALVAKVTWGFTFVALTAHQQSQSWLHPTPHRCLVHALSSEEATAVSRVLGGLAML